VRTLEPALHKVKSTIQEGTVNASGGGHLASGKNVTEGRKGLATGNLGREAERGRAQRGKAELKDSRPDTRLAGVCANESKEKRETNTSGRASEAIET